MIKKYTIILFLILVIVKICYAIEPCFYTFLLNSGNAKIAYPEKGCKIFYDGNFAQLKDSNCTHQLQFKVDLSRYLKEYLPITIYLDDTNYISRYQLDTNQLYIKSDSPQLKIEMTDESDPEAIKIISPAYNGSEIAWYESTALLMSLDAGWALDGGGPAYDRTLDIKTSDGSIATFKRHTGSSAWEAHNEVIFTNTTLLELNAKTASCDYSSCDAIFNITSPDSTIIDLSPDSESTTKAWRIESTDSGHLYFIEKITASPYEKYRMVIPNDDDNFLVNMAQNYYDDTDTGDDEYYFYWDLWYYRNAPFEGIEVRVKVNEYNDGACSLKFVDTIDAIKIKHDQDPDANCIEPGMIIDLIFDGTNWQMMNPCAN